MKHNWIDETLEIIFSERKKYTFKPELFILFFGFLLCIVAWLTTENLNLFGHKSTSIFDIWTFAHISTGAILSVIIISLRKVNIHHPIILLLLISSTWEIIEHYLETIGIPVIENWFGGQETLINRLIGDQLSLVIGFTIIKYKPKLFPFALVIALGILFLHIFLGDSMYFFR